MKTNKYSDLINFGLSPKTLMSLSESEINVLHKNIIESEKTKTAPPKTAPPKTRPSHPGKNPSPGIKTAPKAKRKEEANEVQNFVTSGAKYSPTEVASMKNKGESFPPGTVTFNPDGSVVVTKEGEMTESKKKSKKSKKSKVNPWAVCHAQLGPKKNAKFEKCVMSVKKSISEGKDPYAVLLENKILSLVEKYVRPKMKKGELMDLIGKKKMNLPIGKLGSIGVANEDVMDAPVTKPGTKPGTKTPPKTRPSHPGRNPNPNVNPAPKAKSPENVKTDMISAIMNIFKKSK